MQYELLPKIIISCPYKHFILEPKIIYIYHLFSYIFCTKFATFMFSYLCFYYLCVRLFMYLLYLMFRSNAFVFMDAT